MGGSKVRRTFILLLIISAFVFATSATVLAENGPRWPVITGHGQIVK